MDILRILYIRFKELFFTSRSEFQDDSLFQNNKTLSPQFPGVENLSLWEYENIKKVYETRVMGTPLCLANIIEAIKYLVENGIQGDIVECGVWRGGSSILAAESILHFEKFSDRKIWLYDTFGGMTAPTSHDIRIQDNKLANEMKWYVENSEELQREGYIGGVPAAATLEDVKSGFAHLQKSNIDIRYVIGPVEETLTNLENLPKQIALLKLDTDWYESTLVELKKLYGLVAPGGVIFLDDYDYWSGTRKAFDEFKSLLDFKPLLIRLDHGRILIKQ